MTTHPVDETREVTQAELAEALRTCAEEPIHLIGNIQSVGILMGMTPDDMVIRVVSGNIGAFTDFGPEDLLGKPLQKLLGESQADKLKHAAALLEEGVTIWSVSMPVAGRQERFDAQIFKGGDLLVLEIETTKAEVSDVFHELFVPIRDALWKLDAENDMHRYTQAVVDQVRLLTGFDRVMMYQFDSNWDGEVVAESRIDEVGSYLGNRFPASDIPPQARLLYTRNLVRLIANVDGTPVPLIQEPGWLSAPVDLTYSWMRSMSPVHLEYLRNMEVSATLSISLVQGDRLWGLIACHHMSPKYVGLRARELNEFIGRVVSLKLTNMEDSARTRMNRKIRDLLTELTHMIRHTDDLDGAMYTLRGDILNLVHASGVVVAIEGKQHRLGDVPTEAEMAMLLNYLRLQPESPIFYTEFLGEILPGFISRENRVCGMMVVPLDHTMNNFVMWFRPGVMRTLKWAGRPEKRFVNRDGKLRISPRESFSTWIETYRDRSVSWTQAEMDAANALSLALVDVLHQKALRVSEESYRLLAEHSTDMIARLDHTGRFLFISPASKDLFGISADSLLGRSIAECILAEEQEAVWRLLKSLQESGMQATTVLPGRRVDGAALWVEATFKRIRNLDGSDEIILNARDVTQRHTYQLAIEEVHRRNARILDAAGEGVVSLDMEGHIVYMNEVASRMMGVGSASVIGQHCCDAVCDCGTAVCGGEGKSVCPFLMTVRDGETRQGIHTLRHAGRDPIKVSYMCTPLSEAETISGCVLVFTEAPNTHEEQGTAATEVILDQAMEAVMVTDPQGRVTSINRAFTEITGYSLPEIQGQPPRVLRSGVHTAHFYDEFWRALTHEHRWVGEIWNRRKNGEIYPQWGSVTAILDTDGKVKNYVAVFSDISKAKQAEEKLYYLANHDTLTGLPNRMQFSEQLSRALERARRKNEPLAVAFIDLDRFKIINDTLGHAVGDVYLKCVSERLLASTRKQDILARWGGDEFVLALENPGNHDMIAEAINRLRNRVGEPFVVEGHEVVPTLSIGISVFPADGQQAVDLIKAADAAMYRAKTGGRNRFEFFTESMTLELAEKFSLAGEIHRALAGGELRLYYQPQVDAKTGHLIGVEALSRWQHPTRGLLGPAHFIPMAEELGVIVELGDWVLSEACRQMRAWRGRGIQVPRIAINVAPAQLKESFVASVEKALRESDIPPESLELEITEGSLEAGGVARTVTRQLRALGVLLSVDDFGTGYSSLSHIKLFPVTCFKIDKSFIDGIPASEADAAIVRTILALGSSLHVEVVAEGVETAEQVEFLRAAGVTNIQGFFYGKPMTPEDIEVFLKSHAG